MDCRGGAGCVCVCVSAGTNAVCCGMATNGAQQLKLLPQTPTAALPNSCWLIFALRGEDWQQKAALWVHVDAYLLVPYCCFLSLCHTSSDMTAASAALAAATAALEAPHVSHAGLSRAGMYLTAWKAWVAGDLSGAAKAFALVAETFPRDLFAVKRAQLLCFLGGDIKGMKAVRILANDAPVVGGAPSVWM